MQIKYFVGSTAHIANFKFDGAHLQSDFSVANDGHGGTALTDPPATLGTNGHGGTKLTDSPVVEQQPGNAAATIADDTVLEINAADSGNVTFVGATGTLSLDQPTTFTGTVAGFGAQDRIDLSSIGFGAHTTLGYSENKSHTGGTLTIADGTHAAAIALLGNYMASTLVTASDGHGGTFVTEFPQPGQPPPLAHSHA